MEITDTKVDIGKQKLPISPFKNVHELVKNLDYIIIISFIVSFLYVNLREYLPRRSFFCKKVLTNCYFYGKIGGATMVDARRVSILSSFFHFFRSKFQILFIFANSRKVFCIYAPNTGATMVIMHRFSQKSSKKLKKIAQFSNKIFVQFSQKYTTSALHRVKVLRFTLLKSRLPPANPLYMAPAADCLTSICDLRAVVWPIIWRISVVVYYLTFEKIFDIILKKP